MDVLVTGAAGFIGSEFVRHVLEARPEWRLTLLDALRYAGRFENLSGVGSGLETVAVRGHVPPKAAEKALGPLGLVPLKELPGKAKDPSRKPGSPLLLVLGDVADALLSQTIVPAVDAVVHFAAETHVDRSLQDPGPFVWTNVQGTCALLEGARRSPNLGRFLHVSTDEVYGDAAETGPLDEDSPLRPCNPYSVTKAAAEQMVGAYARAWKIPAVVVRPTNNFGPRQFPEKFVPTVTTRALLGERVPLYGDGRQVRDWLHVGDTARAVRLVLERGQVGGTYNVAGRNPMENRDVARTVLRMLGLGEDRVEHVEDRPGHDRAYFVNDDRIRAELGFENTPGFESLLESTVEWYRENQAWWMPLVDRLDKEGKAG